MKTLSHPVLLELVVSVVAVEDEAVDEEKIEVEAMEMEMVFVAEEENPVESFRKEENQIQNVSFVLETMLHQSVET